MKYRKKPVIVEAQQFDGTQADMSRLTTWVRSGGFSATGWRISMTEVWCMRIQTLEGEMQANAGDYIIKGVQGEFYPIKPDIFAATYEPVEEPTGESILPASAERQKALQPCSEFQVHPVSILLCARCWHEADAHRKTESIP